MSDAGPFTGCTDPWIASKKGSLPSLRDPKSFTSPTAPLEPDAKASASSVTRKGKEKATEPHEDTAGRSQLQCL